MADESLQDLTLKAIISIRKSRSRPSLQAIFKYITKTEPNISVADFKTCIYKMIELGLIYNSPTKGKDSFYINKQSLINNETADIAENNISLSLEIEKDMLITPTIYSVKNKRDTLEKKSSQIKSHVNKNIFDDIGIFVKERIDEEIIPFVEKLESLIQSYESLHVERKLIDAENIKLRERVKTLPANDVTIKHLKDENEFLKKELLSKNEIIKILASEKKDNGAISFNDEPGFEKSPKTARIHNNPQHTMELSNRFNALSNNGFEYNPCDNNTFNAEQNCRPKHNRNYDVNKKCRTTTILGDSTIKSVKPKMVKEKLPAGEKVYVKSFSGATVSNMYHYSKPSLDYEPDLVIMHVGTNDLRTDKNPKEIANEIIKLTKSISTDYNDVMVSSITARSDKFCEKAICVNEELKRLCYENKLMYIDNGNIRPRYHISSDKLHLNDNGSSQLSTNFANSIRL